METLLQGFYGVCLYLDDILITGKTDQEHLNNLSAVLQRLAAAGIKLKPEKCSFMMTEVEYLGHKISAKGLQPTNQKVRAITEAPFTYQCVTAEIIFGDAKLLWEICQLI